jgi:hypothetical protein
MIKSQPEPWLRGTHPEIAAVPRAVVHAIELADEDLRHWCGQLNERELNVSALGLPSVASQLRHIGRSLDRLLTYAEGSELNEEQLEALEAESDMHSSQGELFEELSAALALSCARVLKLAESSVDLDVPKAVGRKRLPSTMGGLLVHMADHTQRHVGQAITTAKVLLAQREG